MGMAGPFVSLELDFAGASTNYVEWTTYLRVFMVFEFAGAKHSTEHGEWFLKANISGFWKQPIHAIKNEHFDYFLTYFHQG
jgi:hypothetical protein